MKGYRRPQQVPPDTEARVGMTGRMPQVQPLVVAIGGITCAVLGTIAPEESDHHAAERKTAEPLRWL